MNEHQVALITFLNDEDKNKRNYEDGKKRWHTLTAEQQEKILEQIQVEYRKYFKVAVWTQPKDDKTKLELFEPPVRTFTTTREIACNFKTGKVAQRGKLVIEILYDLETEEKRMVQLKAAI